MKYICNDPKDAELFLEIFGSAWKTAAELDRHIGAFLMLNKEKRAVLDKNAAHCFAVKDDCPDYSAINNILSVTRGLASDIETRFVSCDEGLTAGFVYLKELDGLQSLHCGLCTQGELTRTAAKDPLSAIMMITVAGAVGTRETLDACWFTAADTMINALPPEAMLTRLSENEFRLYLPSSAGDPVETAEMLCEMVRGCRLINRFGTLISEKHTLSLSIGICGGDFPPAYKIHGSAFALFEADTDSSAAVKVFHPENYEKGKDDFYSILKLSQLIEDNLFVYHFQPIVSAHNGEIVAYEALMRSDPSIGYGPLEILDLAEKRGRLYDIELATIRNSLQALSENQSIFEKRKLFINSLPSQMLSEKDFSSILSDYGELLEKTVIEFTEHAEVSDNSLKCIKERLKNSRMGLAIDDYGTGYSNTSNLMRYSPDFVKIDRSLIADIDKKPKMQLLVSGIIDFIHSTGGMALAEGVETLGEVRAMINLSVDLLQGYYVSRPKPVLLNEISEKIREEIVIINLEAKGSIQKVYRASGGDTIDLSMIALEKYTSIFIEGGKVTLKGEKDRFVRIPITVKQDSECEIVLHNAYIEPENDVNVLTLSENSHVRIICEGDSVFSKGAVIVPETASLRISGYGSLSVLADSENCCAIGNSHDAPFGDILIDMGGKLSVSVNGVNGIGIGGGSGGSVEIAGGSIDIKVASFSGIGIGSQSGTARIIMHDCTALISANSTEAVCVGSAAGGADINMYDISFSCVCTGNVLCAVGTLGREPAVISMHDLHITTDLRGRSLINIGSSDSVTDCAIDRAQVELYSEGSAVTGIGDRTGGGSVSLIDTDLSMKFLTGNSYLIGSPNGSHELVRVIKKISLNE